MTIIALDSSGTVATVAIARDGRLLAEYTVDNGMTHSQTMLPMLDAITKQLNLKMEEVDAVAVADGPGSFTGLRIGCATAKGIGLAIGKPVIAVPTLEALACNVYGTQELVCPMMNARREQIYTALYAFTQEKEDVRSQLEKGEYTLEVLEDQTAEDVREWCHVINSYARPTVLLGDGADDFRSILEEELQVPYRFAPLHQNRQRAGALAMIAMQYYKQGKIQDAAQVRPVYLRKSQAEREREARLAESGTEGRSFCPAP